MKTPRTMSAQEYEQGMELVKQMCRLYGGWFITEKDLAEITADTKPVSDFQTEKNKKAVRTKPLTHETFSYRYKDAGRRLTTLYQSLLRAGWIAADTAPDDFTALFEGRPCTVRVKWTGTQQHLYYLIRRLVDRGLVTVPQGATIWQIAESHFTGKGNRAFRQFNKQKEPQKARAAIDKLVDVLDPSVG